MSAPTDTNYPTASDNTTSLPNPTATDTTKAVPHAELHNVQNKAIIALEGKLGTGSSTPTADKVLMGNDTGTSSWTDQVPQSSITDLTSDLAAKAASADLATVATSGSYTDLTDQPDIPATFDDLTDGTTNKAFTATLKTKVDGIAAGAEVNTVDSVNTKTGTVVLDPDDLDDTSTTHKFVTAADITLLGNTSGTNTGDQTTITGNAGTATKLETARNINNTSFDGSADITISADHILPSQTGNSGKYLTTDGSTASWGTVSGGGGTGSGANLSTTLTSTTVQVNSDTGTDALIASADVTNAGVLTSADWQTIQDALTLTGAQAPTNKDLSDSSNTFPTFNQNTTGSAATLTTARTIQTNLASTSSSSFDGSANITPGITGTLPTSHGGTGATTQATAYAALFPWSVITTTTQTAVVNHGYISNDASLVTITLPSTYAVGSIIEVCGMGAGGWKIAQPTGDNIVWLDKSTTTGTSGSLASTTDGDYIKLLCTVANTTWTVIGSQGNITVT